MIDQRRSRPVTLRDVSTTVMTLPLLLAASRLAGKNMADLFR